jgi:hypothetical protein
MLFLLGATLVGGAAGFSAKGVMDSPKPRSQRAMRDQLSTRMRLSPEQRTAFDSILDARNRRFQAILAPHRPAMDSVRESARSAIRERLSADQQREWDAILAEQEKDRQE